MKRGELWPFSVQLLQASLQTFTSQQLISIAFIFFKSWTLNSCSSFYLSLSVLQWFLPHTFDIVFRNTTNGLKEELRMTVSQPQQPLPSSEQLLNLHDSWGKKNNPYNHSQITLILSSVLYLSSFLTCIGFHRMTSLSCIFWVLVDLQPFCSTEVKSEERWGDGDCDNEDPIVLSSLSQPAPLLLVFSEFTPFSIFISNLYQIAISLSLYWCLSLWVPS